MKPTVEKLVDELTELRGEEKAALARLDEIRRRQATIINRLQVKPEESESPRRKPTATNTQKRVTTRRLVAAKPVEAGQKVPDAARIREYVATVPDGAVLTVGGVAAKLGIKGAVASTALSRLAGKMVERMPGTKRGKFRKISRAA